MVIKIPGFAIAAGLVLTGFLSAQYGDKALTMKPERTVSFTTDEGTWMSVTVSPDGQTLVFELMGHLYSMPIAGGQAKAITEGMSFNKQPRFSPDGRHIVFVSDRSGDDNLWVINADGSKPIPITSEENAMFTSPVWGLDGRSIVVSKKKPHYYRGAFELWQYDLNGGTGVQLVKSKPSEVAAIEKWHNALGATVAPDGRSIYYAKRLGVWAAREAAFVADCTIRFADGRGGDNYVGARQRLPTRAFAGWNEVDLRHALRRPDRVAYSGLGDAG